MANGNDPFGAPVPLKTGQFGPSSPVSPAMAIASGASPDNIQAATQRDAKQQATSYRVMRMAPLESQSMDAYLRRVGYDPDNPNAKQADAQVTLKPRIYQEQAAPDLPAFQQDAHKITDAAGLLGGGQMLGLGVNALSDVPAVRSAGTAVSRALRTERGTLKPAVRTASRLGGAALGHLFGVPEGELIGALTGPSLVDTLLPDPDAEYRARGAFMNKGYRSVTDMPSGGPLGRTTLGDDEFVAGTKPRSLVLTPEEAATEERMQGIAKKRASERGMQFAAGMTPREGRAVPRYPARAPLEESEPVNVERLRQIAGPLDTPRLGEVPRGKPGEGAAAVGLTTEPPRTIPEQVAQSNVHLIERMKQVLRNPNATPAEIREARARLAEMGNR